MSDLRDLVAEAEDIMAHRNTLPFRPDVLLSIVIRLAKEVERIEQRTEGSPDPRPAAQKGSQRKRAGAEPKGHPSDAG